MPTTVTVEPRSERVRVFFGDTLVADSTSSALVHETGLPPRRYIPPADVLVPVERAAGVAHCPFKGQWSWLSVTAGDQVVERAAWTYFEVTPACESVKDYVAFDEGLATRNGGRIEIG